jgi:SAM-dependent methyltransferase
VVPLGPVPGLLSTVPPVVQGALSPDSSRHLSSKNLVRELFSDWPPARVLDLGCGEGDSRAFFEATFEEAAWQGVDVADSPEVSRRSGTPPDVTTFDGIHIPHPSDTFDLVFCHQVLEHVRYPDALLADVVRVLAPGGWFVGAVSYLEPYHSHSLFNFTPYGAAAVLADAGLARLQLYPDRDALTLLGRSFAGRRLRRLSIWRRRPCFFLVDVLGRLLRLAPPERALAKILASGSLTFAGVKPGSLLSPDERTAVQST